MALTVQLNGQTYENVLSAQVTRSMRAGAGSFQFSTSAQPDGSLPVQAGDLVKILADNEPVVTGFIDSITVNYDGQNHTVSAAGRSKTQDLIDSTVGNKKEFTGNISLVSVIKSVISGLGADIDVVDETDGIDPFGENEITSAEIGQRAFEFIESFSRKRQVLITTDGDGNLVLTRGSTTPSGLVLVNNRVDPERVNNVLSSRVNFDLSRRYNTYLVQSQGNPTFSLSSDTAEQLTEVSNQASDSAIRGPRRLEFQGEESLSTGDAGKRAAWEANLRRANSMRYEATVQGHSLNGALWNINQLVSVKDDFARIEADLLISDITYNYSLDDGSTSRLTLTLPDAFTVQAELDSLTANSESIGESFF